MAGVASELFDDSQVDDGRSRSPHLDRGLTQRASAGSGSPGFLGNLQADLTRLQEQYAALETQMQSQK